MSKTEISGIKTSVFLEVYVDKLTTVKLNANGLRSEVKKIKNPKRYLYFTSTSGIMYLEVIKRFFGSDDQDFG